MGLHNCYTEGSGNFSESVEALSSFGYKYSLQKFASPWDDTYEWVYGSKEELNDPVIYDFNVYGYKWRLEILPKSGFTITDICYICSSEVELLSCFWQGLQQR